MVHGSIRGERARHRSRPSPRMAASWRWSPTPTAGRGRWPSLLPTGPDILAARGAWQAVRMQRWQGPAEVPQDWGPCVVTIGEFDGVHRGHQRTVSRARQAAAELGLRVAVVTFDPHPDEVIRPGSHPPLLATGRRRLQLLAGLGVDAVCVIAFTLEFSRLSAEEFVRTVLADRLHAARVVVGEDFRFGHKAAGDVALLAELGEKYDFTVEGVPLLIEDAVTVSSTVIRERLAAGDVTRAAELLGRPHRVEGVVVRGHQRGRALGFPTANLETPEHTAIPADGIYAGWLTSRDLGWDESDVRRRAAHCGGARAGPGRSRPVRDSRGGRLRGAAAGDGEVRLGGCARPADAPRRGRRPAPAHGRLAPCAGLGWGLARCV